MKNFFLILLSAFVCLLSNMVFAADTIKLGAIYPKSGDAKAITEEHLTATQLAVAEINHNGGVLGRQIELIEFNNESSSLGARKTALLAAENKVAAVAGPSWSSHALAAAPVLQKAGIPMITPTASNPKVTQVGDFIFRLCFIDTFQGRMLAKFAREDLKAENAVTLINAAHVYSTDLAEFFKTEFENFGGKIVKSIFYSEDSSDYSEILQILNKISFDLVFIPGYSRDAARIIKAAAAMGIQTTFLGGDGWSHLMLDYAGDAIDSHYYLTHWSQSSSDPKSRALVKKLLKNYNSPQINAGMVLAYDTVYLFADAVTRAGSADPASIRDALANTRDFVGVTGRIQFDQNRNPVKPAVILQFKGGKTVVCKKIVP